MLKKELPNQSKYWVSLFSALIILVITRGYSSFKMLKTRTKLAKFFGFHIYVTNKSDFSSFISTATAGDGVILEEQLQILICK